MAPSAGVPVGSTFVYGNRKENSWFGRFVKEFKETQGGGENGGGRGEGWRLLEESGRGNTLEGED